MFTRLRVTLNILQLKSQVQVTSLFTSARSSPRGCQKKQSTWNQQTLLRSLAYVCTLLAMRVCVCIWSSVCLLECLGFLGWRWHSIVPILINAVSRCSRRWLALGQTAFSFGSPPCHQYISTSLSFHLPVPPAPRRPPRLCSCVRPLLGLCMGAYVLAFINGQGFVCVVSVLLSRGTCTKCRCLRVLVQGCLCESTCLRECIICLRL